MTKVGSVWFSHIGSYQIKRSFISWSGWVMHDIMPCKIYHIALMNEQLLKFSIFSRVASTSRPLVYPCLVIH